MLNHVKHEVRRNNRQIRKAQARTMAFLYQTFAQAQAAWDARQAQEYMPEVQGADAGDFYDADISSAVFEGRD